MHFQFYDSIINRNFWDLDGQSEIPNWWNTLNSLSIRILYDVIIYICGISMKFQSAFKLINSWSGIVTFILELFNK